MACASSVMDRHTGRHCEKQRDAAIAMTDRGAWAATACGLSMNRFKVRVRYRAGFGRLAMTNRGLFMERAGAVSLEME